MNLAIEEARTFLDESIISIVKTSSSKHSVKFLLQREVMMFAFLCLLHL